tara:strand:- start:28 stop:351 length:324 start_codon:yes stop_codon:yes gene_type:complete
MATTIKVTTSATTKSVGNQTAAKSSESFSLNTKKITHDSPGITAKNLSAALDEVAGQQSKQASAPSSPIEGNMWYDTDDDVMYIRDEDSWNEIHVSGRTALDGGTFT